MEGVPRRSFLRLAGLGAAVLTAGCPGDVGETETRTETPTETTTRTEPSSPTGTPTPETTDTPTETPTPECADEPLPSRGTDAWPQPWSDSWRSKANLDSDPLPATPTVQWIRQAGTGNPPLVAGGRVFVLGENDRPQTLVPDTGSVESTYDAPPADATPPAERVRPLAVVNQRYLLSAWRSVFAYDTVTGRREWRYTLPELLEDDVQSTIVDYRLSIETGTVANDTLYLGIYRPGSSEVPLETVSAVVAVSLGDRSERWRQFLKPPDVGEFYGWRVSSLFVSDSRLFVRSGGDVFSLDTDTGDVLWQEELAGDNQSLSTLTGCSVVVSDGSGLTGLDPATGAERWHTDGTIGRTATDGRAMYGADFKGSLVKRDGVTGREVWTFDPEGEFASEGPAVGPRYAYVVVRDDSQQEFVSAVDRERGAEAWRVRLPVPEAPPGVSAPLRPSSLYTGGFPVLSGGRLYLPRFDDDNDLLFLYALG